MAACALGSSISTMSAPRARRCSAASSTLALTSGVRPLASMKAGTTPMPHTANSVGKVRREVGVHGLARAVERVAAGDGVERVRCVLHRARERTNLIERAAESDHAVAADYAVRRLQRHGTAEAARLANGAAVSLPSVTVARPAATAAALPPDEPPGTRARSHGLRVGPKALVSVEEPNANSSMLSLPSGMRQPPAYARRT